MFGSQRITKDCRRFINLQEYQSKNLLKSFNVTIQRGSSASTVDESLKIASQLKDTGAKEIVIKAQVLAGGRGKGHLSSGMQGGVKFSDNPAHIAEFSKNMLGYNLITKQTSAEGEKVNKVLICESVNIVSERYLAFLLSREHGGPVAICSPHGGMDIEEVAEKTPNAIKSIPVNVFEGMTNDKADAIAIALGFERGSYLHTLCMLEIVNLYKLFVNCDAMQVEINPLAVTDDNRVLCIDAKLNFDENASFRQKEIFALGIEDSTKNALETRAENAGLNYIKLDGDIGCLVNGAGLAMATMDSLKLFGGNPANFLDVGGSANSTQVAEALSIITADKAVKTIFINIFGGIMQCDTIAKGIVAAAHELPSDVKVVVRLRGTNMEAGEKILRESNLGIEFNEDMNEASRLAVKLASEKNIIN